MVFEDPFEQLESELFEIALQASDDVSMALDGASVDLDNRKIVWADGERLSIDQSAEKINSNSKIDLNILQYHVILWLEMDYVPNDFNQEEMEIFEKQIHQWVEDYHFGIQ